MQSSDWRKPFLQFKDKLRSRFDGGEELFHGILMSPFYEGNELKAVLKNQAAAYSEQPLAATIETPTEDCKYHAHYFYGDKTICRQLNRDLSGIHDWLRGIPKGLLPKFTLPPNLFESSANVIAWTSVVYFLAWEIDAPYLRAEVDFQSRIHEVASVNWAEFSWPQDCDPRPLLIHQGNSNRPFEKFLETFSEPEEGPWCPDIIGAYLPGESFCGNFIERSLAAVDVLLFMLEQVRTYEAEKQSDQTRAVKVKRKKSDVLEEELIELKATLRVRHNPRVYGENARNPMTTEQIAKAMKWVNANGKPLQAKASRRMKAIFGPNGMKRYCGLFTRKDFIRGLKNILANGTVDIEAVDILDEE
jgi:hypothetical protein